MAVEWKKKVSQRTQMGKANEAYKSVIGVKSLVLIPPEAAACPGVGVEQFTNGGFESGSLPPWTGNWTVESYRAQAGTYSAQAISSGLSITQTFPKPIPTSCFTGTSKFGLYFLGNFSSSPPTSDGIAIFINYDDSTSTEVDAFVDHAFEPWAYIDLKPYLATGKKVVSIMVNSIIHFSTVYVDSCSLQI